MRRIGVLVAAVLCGAVPAAAQDRVEPVSVGVTAGAGYPAGLAGVRIAGPLGRHGGVDFAIGHVTNGQREPAYLAHLRWIRGGRRASGNSRYWIFGALVTHETSSTLVVFPGNERQTVVERRTLVMPRVGYGWDHVTRHGARGGIELTTGSAGEEAGLLLANAFVTWGPPR
jgi:hypothetical protein